MRETKIAQILKHPFWYSCPVVQTTNFQREREKQRQNQRENENFAFEKLDLLFAVAALIVMLHKY